MNDNNQNKNTKARKIRTPKKPEKPQVSPSGGQGFWAGLAAKLKVFRRTPLGDLTVALAIIICGVLLGVWLVGTCSDVMGIMKDETQVEVTIKGGWSTLRMAQEMEKKGVINHPLVFSIYADAKGGKDKEGNPYTFKSGTYLLDGGMSYDTLIYTLQRRQQSQTVRITFTEGMTVSDMGKLLEESGVCLKSEFVQKVNTGSYNYDFLPFDSEYTGRFYRLEGYLFPDTYDFYLNENVDSVIRRFLNNFNSKFTENMRRKANDLGMTIDQVVTLASIIEKEATDVFEMANVSAVFHNRLNNPRNFPKLQSDVTSWYVKNVINKTIDIIDENYTYAYDTYVRNGLPVGAVCCPGSAALTAALNPSEGSPYYFFVTDKNGDFYYGETLAQHNSNIRKAKSVGSAVGGTHTHD